VKDIFVVTHTEASHHLADIVGGWYDSALTARGLSQAEAVSEQLGALIGQRDVEIYSSDLRRASQTASPISRRLNALVTETQALREISYGVAGGKPQAWLDTRYSAAPDGNRLDHDCGIEGAETRRDVANRVYPFIDEVVSRPCQSQILVTHGFTLSIVIAAWMKVPIDGMGFVAFPVASGSITHLHQDDFFRNRSVKSLGMTGHLAGA